MLFEISLGQWVPRTMVPTTPLGLRSYTEYTRASEVSPMHPVPLSHNWTKVAFTVPPSAMWPAMTSFNAILRHPQDTGVFPAGEVWIDDVVIRNITGG